MTRYITNFADSDVGEFPTGWTRRFDFDDTPTAHKAVVEIDVPRFKRRQLRISCNNAFGFMTLDAVDADTNRQNVELLFSFKRVDGGSPAEPVVSLTAFARFSGVAGYELAILLDNNASPNLVAVQRIEGGVPTATPLVSAYTFASATTEYNVRWRVQDLPGSPSTVQLSIRVWPAGTPEPVAWTATATDGGGTVFGLKGSVGIDVQSASPTALAAAAINFVSVATNGDTAYLPKTNAEFLAWLDDQTANRVSLFEMQAYGYEANALLRNAQPPNEEAYARFPGGEASPRERFLYTADTPKASFVGATSVTVMVDMNPDDFTSLHLLVSKGDAAAVDFGWFFQMLATGQLQFAWSTTGADLPFGTCTVLLPTAAGTRISVAAELLFNNGAGGWTLKFWVSMDKGRSWGQLGADVTGAGVTSIFNSTQPIEIGSQQGGQFAFKGKIYRVQTWYGRAITDPSNAYRATDYYPQKMDPLLYNAGTYKSLYTGETYSAIGGVMQGKQPSSAALRNCYLSNKGFTSADMDIPALQFYPPWITRVPPFSRTMGLALTGAASTGLGTFVVSNPADANGGVRDKWTRIKWKRDFVRQLLGDSTWARVDFRTVVLGRLGQPTAGVEGISFAMTDLSDSLNDPLQLNLYDANAGSLAGKPKALYVGYNLFVEPPCINTATQEYQYNDGPTGTNAGGSPVANYLPLVYDNFVRADTLLGATITAVNTVTETLTTGAAHGFAAGGTLYGSGSLPAPLVVGTAYYVIAAGLTATDFRLSATPGGAAINITGATTGGQLSYSPCTLYPSKGTFILARQPTGRVVVVPPGAIGTEDGNVANILDWIVFKKFGLPLAFKDTAKFAALATQRPTTNAYQAGMAILPQQGTVLCKDALLRFAQGAFVWYGFSTDGLLQVGKFSAPSQDTTLNVQSFIESDVKQDTLRMTSRILPLDFTKVPVTYGPLQISGPANTSDPLFALGAYTATPLPSTDTGIPLDGVPAAADMRTDKSFDTLYGTAVAVNGLQNDLATLFGTLLGVYEFKTRFRAMNLNIGDQIQLTHSKLDFELFGATNVPSPDSTTVSQPNAIVLGVETDLSVEDGFPCTVTVMRSIPGYYPTANLT